VPPLGRDHQEHRQGPGAGQGAKRADHAATVPLRQPVGDHQEVGQTADPGAGHLPDPGARGRGAGQRPDPDIRLDRPRQAHQQIALGEAVIDHDDIKHCSRNPEKEVGSAANIQLLAGAACLAEARYSIKLGVELNPLFDAYK
jgi:hypothetical protein